jgi:hypothetical protein
MRAAEERRTGGRSSSKNGGAKARMARELRSKEQRRQTLEAKVKNRPFSAYQIYRPRGVLSGAHAPRALTAGEMLAHWRAGPTTTTAAT